MICPEIAKIEMPNASGGFVKADKKSLGNSGSKPTFATSQKLGYTSSKSPLSRHS
jgi:hypothetical protein